MYVLDTGPGLGVATRPSSRRRCSSLRLPPGLWPLALIVLIPMPPPPVPAVLPPTYRLSCISTFDADDSSAGDASDDDDDDDDDDGAGGDGDDAESPAPPISFALVAAVGTLRLSDWLLQVTPSILCRRSRAAPNSHPTRPHQTHWVGLPGRRSQRHPLASETLR